MGSAMGSEGSPRKDTKMSDSITIDSTALEEVTEKGIKIIDESLERVKVHLAKEMELDQTDLASVSSFELSDTKQELLVDKSDSEKETHETSEDVDVNAVADSSKTVKTVDSSEKECTVEKTTKEVEERVAKWGEPMNLPSPIPPPTNYNTRVTNNETPGKKKK